MRNEKYGPPAPPFNHKNDITIGKGRVIYALATPNQPEGYVLPGGRRTQDREEAAVVAFNINTHYNANRH